MKLHSSHLSLAALAALLPLSAITLTGCSLQNTDTTASSVEPVTLPAFEGRVMGGETPIAGSNIILWQTDPANGGYASTAAVKLGTATGSTPGGNFGFATGYTCTPGQFVYITSTGGDTTNGSANPIINNNLVLMAALGSCSNFASATAQGKVTIILNELSTVAAAYALDGFMTVAPGTTGKQLVYVGAPAKNNATAGSCSGTGASMTCTAAGLAHAFANAAALADPVHFDGTEPTGAARTFVPGNPTSSVPTALINTLGNILQFCTNSAGGVAGDGSACGLLFTDATSTATTPVVPTDTLTALMNVARQPYNNIGASCTGTSGGLFCLAGSFASFVPSLTAVPHDWSIAIAYSGFSNPIAVTNYTDPSGTATFTAANNFLAGNTVTLSGFPTSTFLNGQTVTVLAAGLSTTQFEAAVTNPAISITAYSITSNVATFTAANNFAAGESVTLSGFPTSTFFNGVNVTVLATGLSSTQFEAAFTNTNVTATTESGSATPIPNTGTEAGTATLNGSFGSPQYLALDASDNVYVETANAYSPTAGGLAAMTSTGAPLWSVPQSAALCVAGVLAPDIVGNVWLSVPVSSTGACAYAINGYSTATGAQTYTIQPPSGTVCNTASPTPANCPGFTAYDTTHSLNSLPKPLAFDRFNNLWYGRFTSSCTSTCVAQYPFTAGTSGGLGTYAAPAVTEGTTESYSNQMIIDANDNVWISNESTASATAGKLYEIYNTGTAAVPTYTTATGATSVSLSAYDNGGLGIDSGGNIWTGSNLAIQEFTPTGSGATSSFGSAVSTTVITGAHPLSGEVDGGGIYWTGSLASSGSIFLQITPLSPLYNSTTASKNSQVLRPCYVANNASTCDTALGTSTYQTGDPKAVQVDSAGSIWIAAGVVSTQTTGLVVQIIGAASPTWPSYQYGVFGKEPQ